MSINSDERKDFISRLKNDVLEMKKLKLSEKHPTIKTDDLEDVAFEEVLSDVFNGGKSREGEDR